MKAVVLTAGEGTRMRPLTWTRPKPMLPVAGDPLLTHVLEECVPHVDGFVLVTGYRGDVIREHFGDTFAGRPIEYVHQADQLGTAHAIGLAEPYVEDRFLALNGDVIFQEGLVDGVHSASGTAMAVQTVPNPSEYGIVSHEDGAVTAIVEKPADPPSDLANLGIYTFTPEVFEVIEAIDPSERGEYEITDALQTLIDEGTDVTPLSYDGPWIDVGRPWDLLEANARLLGARGGSQKGTVESRATLDGGVVVEAGARIRNGTYIEGPTLVKRGADVGPNAYVRGHTVIGEDTRVGNAVEIKNAILMADAAVGHQSYVGDSILGEGVNLGAGTNVANLRHDERNIRATVKGEVVDTGRRKFGVVLGDGVKTGINTSLNAGVSLPPGATTLPGETVLETPPGTTTED